MILTDHASSKAFMARARQGFGVSDGCGFPGDVIRRGESFLPQLADSGLKADLHFIIANAYADIVGVAAGLSGSGVPAEYAAKAPEARAKAIAHYRYRAGLDLDRTSPAAHVAWREVWRLLAGLPPHTLYFYCIAD